MRRFFLGIIATQVLILVSGCTSADGIPCADDTACPDTQYCNKDNPVLNELTGEMEGTCTEKPYCDEAAGLYCPDGWECTAEGSCQKKNTGTADKDTASDKSITKPDEDTASAVDNTTITDTAAQTDSSLSDTVVTQDIAATDSDTTSADTAAEHDAITSDTTIPSEADTAQPDSDTAANDTVAPDTTTPDTVAVDTEVDAAPDTLADVDSAVPDADSKPPYPAFTFNTADEGWTHTKADNVSTSWPLDNWARGKATTGPGSCHEGNGCWATNLTGAYVNCQRAKLVSPAINLSAFTGENLKLSFWHYHDFWTGSYGGSTYYDGGIVEISKDGNTWVVAPGVTYPGTVDINPAMGSSYSCLENTNFYIDGKQGYVGKISGWQKVEITLPAEYLTATFKVRFIFSSGVQKQSTSSTPADYSYMGWYIDDVAIEPVS